MILVGNSKPTPPDIRVRIRRFGWSKQAQINTSGLPGFNQAERYRHFSVRCIMSVRTCSLITATIYPSHSAGHRSGLRRDETSGYTSPAFGRPASFSPTTMPSADFCHVIASPYGSVSPLMDIAADLPG